MFNVNRLKIKISALFGAYIIYLISVALDIDFQSILFTQ